MTDLNMFRAMQQSREIIKEEFVPREPIRLASEVVGTTPKHVSATTTPNARMKTQLAPRVRTQP
jgi:hypothetical protein